MIFSGAPPVCDFPTPEQAKYFLLAGEDNFLSYAGSMRSPDA